MSITEKKIFISDCEGPISKNDNAFELAKHFIPEGNKVFSLISKYDDVLADVVKKPGYQAGNTLKLILPFLKAYEASNEKIKKYSSENILLVPGAVETLRFVKGRMPSYVISTSYEPYLSSLCDLVGFPFENVYCTRLDMDKYEINEREKGRLKKICKKISSMPMIKIPENANSIKNLSKRDQKTISELDKMFWEDIPSMSSGVMLEEVNPVGGNEKVNAVKDVIKKLNSKLSNVIYFGDSITDSSSFSLIRKRGGLTVSFNGNKYAIREAEIAVLSENTVITSILADAFNKYGREGVIRLVEEWGYSILEKTVDPSLRGRLIKMFPKNLPRIEMITEENREKLSNESVVFRVTVRGEAVGKLG